MQAVSATVRRIPNVVANAVNATTDSDVNTANTRQTLEPTVRLIYIDEGIRVVTIAYQLYPGTHKKNIKFAASIFRKESDKEVFVRKQHLHTACERLIVRPMWTKFSIPERYEQAALYDKAFYEDLKQHLRKEVHKRGTGSKQRLSRVEMNRPAATVGGVTRLALGNSCSNPEPATPPAYFDNGVARSVTVRT